MGALRVSCLILILVVAWCEAGTITKIIGKGRTETRRGEFPFFAFMLDKNTGGLIAAGVLVKPNVVLTIGYNFYVKPYTASDILVVLGAHNRSLDERTRQEINVTQIVYNPLLFESCCEDVEGDAALLQLDREAVLGRRVEVFPIRNIARTLQQDNRLARDGDCTVCGYGHQKFTEYEKILPRTLQKFKPKIVLHRQCNAFTSETYGFTALKAETICSINEDLTEIGPGDAGDPLLCVNEDGNLSLHGLASGSSFSSRLGYTFYARLSTHRAWILKTAKRLE